MSEPIEISVIMFSSNQPTSGDQPALGMSSKVPVEPNAIRLVARETAEKYTALPIKKQGRVLLVAFANPDDQNAVDVVAQETGLRVRAVEASAEDIRNTIPLAYGAETAPEVLEGLPTNIGWLLIDRGLLQIEQLEEALAIQSRGGGKLGTILVNMGVINRLLLAEVLAEQFKMPFINLREEPPDADIVRRLDAKKARGLKAVPVRWSGDSLVVAITDPTDQDLQDRLNRELKVPLIFCIASELDINWILDRVYRSSYIEESIMGLLYRDPDESAYETFSDTQLILLLALIALIVICLALAPEITLIVINSIFTIIYISISFYRLWLAYRGANTNLTINVTAEDLAALEETDLPVYSILVPLYKEKDVLPEVVRSIDRLNYPKSKLDVKLLLEERDQETIQAAIKLRPPAHFEFVYIPDAPPHTKPKACNYGLVGARGTFTVIYDAEDRPDADQLRMAVAAFRKAPLNVACLQAKLNYYNKDQNILTRWFTLEYSSWFDLILPGLDNTGAPIPLGGTSNHFYTERLRELGAWDPFNVTEDADLGIRMFKHGYRTGMIDSTTYEESNSQVGNWIRQRSRWVKGYMQTWLVHMRHPLTLLRTLGFKQFLSFHFIIGGTPFVFLSNPFYWIITSLWFMRQWSIIDLLFPNVIYYLAMFNLVIGNFVFMYMNLIGAHRRGYYELTRYALISPLYWVLMSIASWKALWQLITRPFYWEKTIHGLHKPKTGTPTATAQPSTAQTS
ncbi:MAG: glycosyltransferase family 2 protein [Chloroflexota bacterium]